MKQYSNKVSPTGFLKKDIAKFSKENPTYWKMLGEKNALEQFEFASNRVPAYKDFLKRNNIDKDKIKTIDDFRQLPLVDKENYLKAYDLNLLVADGDLSKYHMVSRSSGSSGKPFYWPRSFEQEEEVGYMYDLIYQTFFKMDTKKTLVVIGYAMGSWVAGTFTLTTGHSFSEQHKSATFVSPGYNTDEIIEVITNLGPYYDQVALGGYPPLVKEVIDTGIAKKIDWPKYNLKLFFGAEAFSEDFRDYILDKIGASSEIFDTMNVVGSADSAILGMETPLTISLRREARKNAKLWDELFGQSRVPTLTQYLPWIKYFETVGSEVVFTSNNGIPLIRYNIHDSGFVKDYNEVESMFQKHGIAVNENIPTDDSKSNYDWKLPFLTIYGKSDNTLKFYGANIYPENIKAALEGEDCRRLFTGKFKMYLVRDAQHNPSLWIKTETGPGVKPNDKLKNLAEKSIYKALIKYNTEYVAVNTDIGKASEPKVELVEFGEPEFKSKIKITWAENEKGEKK